MSTCLLYRVAVSHCEHRMYVHNHNQLTLKGISDAISLYINREKILISLSFSRLSIFSFSEALTSCEVSRSTPFLTSTPSCPTCYCESPNSFLGFCCLRAVVVRSTMPTVCSPRVARCSSTRFATFTHQPSWSASKKWRGERRTL